MNALDISSLKLAPELVPSTAWFSNLRSMATPTTWDLIRRRAYKAYNHKCCICGIDPVMHGSRVECHEVWHYDDANSVISLKSLECLCKDCHSVKHIGLAYVRGDHVFQRAAEHMAKINHISIIECMRYIKYFDNLNLARSGHNWEYDIKSLLKVAPELEHDVKFTSLINR